MNHPILKIAFIDHYDSFSFNLVEWLRSAGDYIEVNRICFDDKDSLEKLKENPIPTVISPGPNRPEDVLETVSYIKSAWNRVPMLGVCLGHQAMCFSQGFNIIKAQCPHHGSVSWLSFDNNDPLFSECTELKVVTYNSLVVEPSADLESKCKIIAANDENEVQAIRFLTSVPTYGVQFHPEAHLTKEGEVIARNWINLVEGCIGLV